MEKKRVLVAMSGGVDSSAAALLLQQQGYACDGAMLKLYSGEVEGTCCSADDADDARSVAYRLGMKFYVFNETERFARDVMDHFVAEYCAGHTPNPCIDCNRCLKFGALLERALVLGYDYLATGHYARVGYDPETGLYRLLRGRDRRKDQSYVLYQLTQHQLSHLLLPVGEFDKPAIRESAREAGLLNADKADSQDICFVPDGDYGRFLREYGHVEMTPGDFVDREGRVLGRHKGLPCYTTGQRKGLGVSAGRHVYVVRKNAADNTILLGDNEELYARELTACRVNWISGTAPTEPVAVTARRIKSRHNSIVCIVLGGLIDNGHRLAALVLIGKGQRRSLGKQSGKRKHQLTLAVAGVALQQCDLAEGDIGIPQPAHLFRGDLTCLDDFQLCWGVVRIVCHCLVLLFDR